MIDRESIYRENGLAGENGGVLAGKEAVGGEAGMLSVGISPVDGGPLPAVRTGTPADLEIVIRRAGETFRAWRTVPAEVRSLAAAGIALRLREREDALSRLITLETGKTLREAHGEIAASAAFCELASSFHKDMVPETLEPVLLPEDGPRLYSVRHPFGPVAVITAGNYPLLLWAWNAVTAAVCGNTVVWKPSPRVVLSALVVHNIAAEACEATEAPAGVFSLMADRDGSLAGALADDTGIPLLSFTGSPETGRDIGRRVAARMGRSILELGGSNAIVIAPSASLKRAVDAVFASAVLTSGQRCTSCRRLIVHEDVYQTVKDDLISQYASLRIGNPFDPETEFGPLQHHAVLARFREALGRAEAEGGRILTGGDEIGGHGSPLYVRPALVEIGAEASLLQEEWFAPVLFLIRYSGDIREAIRIVDDTPYGLTASLFTEDRMEAALFTGPEGPRVGMAHVNLGTAGADLAVPFGGEKGSGRGRVSGRDGWKQYMRCLSGGLDL